MNNGELDFENRDAEKGIILGMLDNLDVRSSAALALDEVLFGDPVYRRLFSILSGLGDRKEVDRVTLRDMAKEQGIDKNLDYLFEEQAPSREVLRDYYEIIKKQGGKQALEDLSRKIHAELKTGDHAFDVADRISDEIGRIRSACAPLSTRVNRMRPLAIKQLELIEKNFIDKKGMIPGISTGFLKLDQLLTGLNPGLLVIGARPYLGMQEFAMNLALNVSKPGENMHHVLYISSSIGKEVFTRKLLAMLAKVSLPKLSAGYITQKDHSELAQAANSLISRNLYSSHDIRNANEIYRQACFLKARHGLDLVIIDTFQELLHGIDDYRNASFVAHQAARPLKDLHLKLNLPVVVLSELSSDVDKRVRSTKPRVGHLRDYGALEHKAEQIALLHCEDIENDPEGVRLYVDVNKYGNVDHVDLNYTRETGEFRERSTGIDDF